MMGLFCMYTLAKMSLSISEQNASATAGCQASAVMAVVLLW